ncbi:methionyl-tRNA formyltransferase [Deinococcus psychrotolerans]|uniref:Methionyl-tRNA formyltransferase n=1 Tax=Deinococcus psychrotolerans TaxID=2489213 RepID=A0A3G8YD20_9DEIO|nr:methionyl-tRNA formyltransferase [Deinococcus psychrotolerans]AZI43238.1 methionyl-tRNA formyltransferase [Deinococcus psychrotolerans]
MSQRRKVAFFGSPAFALPVLDAILAAHEVVLVVAQPDKPVGRGLKLTPPPIAARAAELGLPLAQPTRLKKNTDFEAVLRGSGAEVAVTCAYGKILPAALLEVPKYGFLNTHTSVLPQLRGAAPIQWALISGLDTTGTTIMQTDVGMDTGPILLQEALPIAPDWTSLSLSAALQTQAARLIVQALDTLDTLTPTAQNGAQATHAAMLDKSDGDVRWADSAQAIYDRYRGVYAWPQTSAFVGGKRLKLLDIRPTEGAGQPAELLEVSAEGLRVACGEGALLIRTVQPEGKKAMSAADWQRGSSLKVGERFDGQAGRQS